MKKPPVIKKRKWVRWVVSSSLLALALVCALAYHATKAANEDPYNKGFQMGYQCAGIEAGIDSPEQAKKWKVWWDSIQTNGTDYVQKVNDGFNEGRRVGRGNIQNFKASADKIVRENDGTIH